MIKQQRKYSLSNNKLFSVMKINKKKNSSENDCNTTIHRVNEHSYIVSFDKLQQGTEFHSQKTILTDIHTNLIRNKENQGFIHIKEYTLDSYECRCQEHNNEEIDNNKYSFNYKLKF
jgi:hypothetical protein